MGGLHRQIAAFLRGLYVLIAAISGWANDVHDASDCSQHMKRHLGGNARQRLHQEVGFFHASLDGAEGCSIVSRRWSVFPDAGRALHVPIRMSYNQP
jgi:hypothetical protein